MEDNNFFVQMEDDLNILVNGRQPLKIPKTIKFKFKLKKIKIKQWLWHRSGKPSYTGKNEQARAFLSFSHEPVSRHQREEGTTVFSTSFKLVGTPL